MKTSANVSIPDVWNPSISKLAIFLVLNKIYLYAIFVWCDTCCFPLSFLLSLGPVNIRFRESSFLIICPRNLICFFLIPIIKVLIVSIFLRVLQCSHIQSILFSLSFCRIMFHQPQICSSIARRLASIGIHVGEMILLNNSVISSMFLLTSICFL